VPETKRAEPGFIQAPPFGKFRLVAVTATTTAELATTTTTTTATLFARAGDVHGQVTSVEIAAVKSLARDLSLFGGAHGHESESAGPAGVAVGHHLDFKHGTMRGKRVLKMVLGGVEGQISYKQLIVHCVMFRRPTLAPDCSRVSGFEPSLNEVHLRIYQTLKPSNNLTNATNIAYIFGFATYFHIYFY
jgi:hypothetical protein